MLFSCDKCTIKVETAVSKKTGKEYVRLILTVNGQDYIIIDNNLIGNILVNNLR